MLEAMALIMAMEIHFILELETHIKHFTLDDQLLILNKLKFIVNFL
jgi:hypothetical protein